MRDLVLSARIVVAGYGWVSAPLSSDEQIVEHARELLAGDGGAAIADQPGAVAAAEALSAPEPATELELKEIRAIAIAKAKAGELRR